MSQKLTQQSVLRACRRLQSFAARHARDKLPLILSVIDQAVLSLFGFLLSIFLIRTWAPELFGHFVVVLTISLVCGSVQGALIGTQLSVLRPHLLRQGEETKLLSSLWAANCFLILLFTFMSIGGIALFWRDQGFTAASTAGIYVGSSLLREYVRYLLFSERRPVLVLATDLQYVSISLILMSYTREFAAFSFPEILTCMACANVLCCVHVIPARGRQFTFRMDRETLATWGRIWRGPARWAFFGALTHEVAGRSHIFIVQAVFGAAAVGLLQAGEMIFRPLFLMAQAWERVATPSFAAFAAASDSQGSASLRRSGLSAALSITILYLFILFLAWPQLENHLFTRGYENMERIVVLWAVATLVQLVCRAFSTELQGFARFGELGIIGAITSLVGLIFLVTVAKVASFEWTIFATVLSNLLGIVLMQFALRRIYRSEHLAASISQTTNEGTLNRLLGCFR